MNRATILLVDDHTIVTDGLRALLEPEFQIIGTASDGRAAVQAVVELKPDVVVLDISMPVLNGLEAAKRIRKLSPKTKIVFLTMHTDLSYVREAMDAGASGYVIKHSASADLQLAIRKALLGKTYITHSIVIDRNNALRKRRDWSPTPPVPLTPRQREVLQLVAEGRSAKEIARILNISHRTVEFHKNRIMEELGIHNTASLTQFAIRHRLLSL